jgi:leucyl-tRNA synthetase
MSKSTGNFITLIDAINEYGADATRLACALAGDSINDANFTKENANAAILQMSTFEMFASKSLEHKASMRRKGEESPCGTFD